MTDHVLLLGIPKHDVGIRAGHQTAFVRMQPVDLGRIGRGQRDELLERDPPAAYALAEKQHQPRLDARQAGRHVMEMGCRSRCPLARRAVETIGTVIGGDEMKGAVAEAVPKILGTPRVAQGWRAYEFGGLPARTLELVDRPAQLLRTGLGEDGDAARMGPADLLGRLGRRDMDKEGARTAQLGEGDGPMGRLALDGGRRARGEKSKAAALRALQPG